MRAHSGPGVAGGNVGGQGDSGSTRRAGTSPGSTSPASGPECPRELDGREWFAGRERLLRDLLVYRFDHATIDKVRGLVRVLLIDSGGNAMATFNEKDALILADNKVVVTRAVAIAHGLGLPLRVEASR